MTSSPCAVCQSNAVRLTYRGPVRDGAFGSAIPAAVTRCEECGVERLEDVQLPSDYYVGDAYRQELQEPPDVEGYLERHDTEQYARFGLMESIRLRNAVVVDVGCAGGSFLDSIAGFARTTIGVEPGTAYCASLRSRGHEVYDSAESALQDWRDRVDVVCCFSVIEHVEDPVGLLSSMRALLRKGRVAVVSTPNRDDILMRLGGDAYRSFFYRKVHRFYFDGASLTRAASAAGFDGTRLRYVHRFGHANFTTWLGDRRPGGETESPLGAVFDQTWRATLEARGLADYLYAYLQA